MYQTISINKNNTLLIVHHGLSGLERENFRAAFVAAGNRSNYRIEADMHETKDDQFVVRYDDSTRRLNGVVLDIKRCNVSEE